MEPMTARSKTNLIRHLALLAFGASALLPARPLRADDGRIAVDVVVDFGGDSHQEKLTKKIVHPTAERPAYYLPVFVGYKEFGYADFVKKPPPPAEPVKRLLVDALASQDYLIMTKQSPPSLVLVFWWGYVAPPKRDPQQFYQINPGDPGFPGAMANNPAAGPGLDQNALLQAVSNNQLYSENGYLHHLMLSMVAGDTLKDRRHTGDDPEMARARLLAQEPIYYILISAFDFDSWLHHKRILVWQAHISTRLWDRSLDEVVSPMVAMAAPLLGRETREPRFFETPVVPLAQVRVGAPVVKSYPAAPPKNP
jgi:hypothetical protein